MPHKSKRPSSKKTELIGPFKLCKLQRLFVEKFASLPPPKRGPRGSYSRVFPPLITLWALIFQRLLKDHTLDHLLAQVANGGCDGIVPGKKPSELIKSQSTSSISDARSRMLLSWLKSALGITTTEASEVRWNGLHVCLMDGSQIRVKPTENMKKKFVTSRNQKGAAYWLQMPVLITFCLFTGVLMATEIGSPSETLMACQIILAAPVNTLFIADRNFGIFRVLATARKSGKHVLCRMSKCRAEHLLKHNGKKLQEAMDALVTWTPSKHDKKHADCPENPITVRFIAARLERRGYRTEVLYFVTTLLDQELYQLKEIVGLYAKRWHVELNLNYLKTKMDLKFITAESAEMAEKEWYAGLIAYNLVRAYMAQAAKRIGKTALELSFTKCLNRFVKALEKWASGREVNWDKVIEQGSECLLPKRKKPRESEPRKKRHIRESFPPLKGSRDEARAALRALRAEVEAAKS
jgi:Transposase DDE domain